jgi:hypothetical protein
MVVRAAAALKGYRHGAEVMRQDDAEDDAAPDSVPGPPWFARKILTDGRELVLWPSASGPGATLYLGDQAAAEYDDAWEFDCLADGADALDVWDPRDQREPPLWSRHPASGRERVRGRQLSITGPVGVTGVIGGAPVEGLPFQ